MAAACATPIQSSRHNRKKDLARYSELSTLGFLQYAELEGKKVISFNVWGEQRLCSPQLFAKVLYDFDADDIQVVVASLNIVIFQCTSHQLHILHAKKILPHNVTKCGLIRKSDAERLCKVLLHLPSKCNEEEDDCKDLDSIRVLHSCFGEQSGVFYPLCYTEDKSACIRCTKCRNFFSPFNFVGHSHDYKETKNVNHWGFDSKNWRLYIRLDDAFYTSKSDLQLEELKHQLLRLKHKFLSKSSKRESFSSTRIHLKLPDPKKIALSNFNSSIPMPSHLNSGPPQLLEPEAVVLASDASKYDKNFAPNVTILPDFIEGSELSRGERERLKKQLAARKPLDDDDDEYETLVCEFPQNKTAGDEKLELAKSVALKVKESLTKWDSFNVGIVNSLLKDGEKGLSVQLPVNTQSWTTSPQLSTIFPVSLPNPVVVSNEECSVPVDFLYMDSAWSELSREFCRFVASCSEQPNLPSTQSLLTSFFRAQHVFQTRCLQLINENQRLKQERAIETEKLQRIYSLVETYDQKNKTLDNEKRSLVAQVKLLQEERDFLARQDRTEHPPSADRKTRDKYTALLEHVRCIEAQLCSLRQENFSNNSSNGLAKNGFVSHNSEKGLSREAENGCIAHSLLSTCIQTDFDVEICAAESDTESFQPKLKVARFAPVKLATSSSMLYDSENAKNIIKKELS